MFWKPNIKAKHLTPKKVHVLARVKGRLICFFELKAHSAELVFLRAAQPSGSKVFKKVCAKRREGARPLLVKLSL